MDVYLKWFDENQKKSITSSFIVGKTLGENGNDLDRMFLTASAITKAFHCDHATHARYMKIGGVEDDTGGRVVHLSQQEEQIIIEALVEQRERQEQAMSQTEQLLRRMTGSITAYMDTVGQRPLCLDYAQYTLGKLYRDGGPVEQDPVRAVIWFTKAAEQDNQYSMYALGKLYLKADDSAKSLRWFQKSANLGNQYAQYRLGKLLLNGDGMAKDIAGAVRWLTQSAEQRNQYAQYALGKLFLLGKDVQQDRKTATRWFTLAAEQGNQYAQYFLDHMNDASSLLTSATRLLHHVGRIFQEQAPPPTAG